MRKMDHLFLDDLHDTYKDDTSKDHHSSSGAL